MTGAWRRETWILPEIDRRLGSQTERIDICSTYYGVGRYPYGRGGSSNEVTGIGTAPSSTFSDLEWSRCRRRILSLCVRQSRENTNAVAALWARLPSFWNDAWGFYAAPQHFVRRLRHLSILTYGIQDESQGTHILDYPMLTIID